MVETNPGVRSHHPEGAGGSVPTKPLVMTTGQGEFHMRHRSKEGQRRRTATAVLAALTISAAVMAPAAARADVLMGGAPPLDGYVTATGTDNPGTTPSDGRVNVAPPQAAEGGDNGAGAGQQPAGQGQQQPAGPVAGNVAQPGVNAARGKSRTTCRTRRSTHTRTCKTYRSGHLTKVCVR